MSEPAPSAVVLGAKNLGGAITRRLLRDGWDVTAVARSEGSLAGVRDAGAHAVLTDASDPDQLRAALAEARARTGSIDLLVNAVSASRGTGTFGGGPFAELDLAAFRGWGVAVAEQAFVFLSEAVRAVDRQDRASIVQITGGSSRRAIAGKGAWAAGTAALRALTHSAALELREQDRHVALLVVDGTIASPKTAGMLSEQEERDSVDQDRVADAVVFLAGQDRRALTHELVLTPAGDRWTP